jgi:hypothetical protein
MADTRLVRVDGDVQLQCFQSSETGNWVGVCEPLKLTVQSETWAALMEDFGLTLNAVPFGCGYFGTTLQASGYRRR